MGTVVRFAKIEQAAELLRQEDAFTRSMSQFDVQSRLKTAGDVQVKELLTFAAQQVEPWTDEEIGRLTGCIESIRVKLSEFPSLWPEAVLLIKSSGEEEGGAAYCRQHAIVLPRRMLDLPIDALERLLAHELFHILSRHDLQRQQRIYSVVGFRPCGDIELPPRLAECKITNPDAPRLNYYLELQTDDGAIPVTPILYASPPNYDPATKKPFFKYLQFRLLKLAREGRAWRAATNGAGEPILLNPQSERSYHEQIGRNTGYIIHPEEVLAENFVHLVMGTEDLPSPEIVVELKAELMKSGA